jgi:hypothetical protein
LFSKADNSGLKDAAELDRNEACRQYARCIRNMMSGESVKRASYSASADV